MIRRLMASSAVLALMTAGAFGVAQAQTQPAQTQDPAAVQQPAAGADTGTAPAATETPAKPIAQEGPTLTPDEPTIATAFIGRSVFSSEGPDSDNIGEVNDLIIGSDGMITHAVVGVGGFLGIGQKDVTVPFDELQVVQDEDGDVRLIYAATRDQLEAAEAFDRTAFDPEERVEEQQAADATATTGAGGVMTTPGAVPVAPADQTAAAADAAEETEEEAEETATAVTTAPADQTAAAPAAPAANTTVVTAAPTDQSTTTTAQTGAVAAGAAGFVNFSDDQIRASDIIGEELYGADNESIGEVSDLVLQPEGNTRVAVIDVGGFLGIGEKRVAIPFDEIEFMQEPAADQTGMAAAPAAGTTAPAAPAAGTTAPAAPAAGTTAPAADATGAAPAPGATAAVPVEPEPRLVVNMTKEQLEQLPEWEDTTEQAAVDATADPNAPAGAAPAGTVTTAPADPNAPAAATTAAGQPAQDQDAVAEFAAATQDLSADDLMGSAVFSSTEENLGEVNDVIFDQGGQIQAVVVDVGGFLGIGEKPVAVEFDALNVQKGANGDVRLMLDATQEQLEAAPSYAETAAAGATQPAAQ